MEKQFFRGVLDRALGFKIYCEPETTQHKITESILNIIKGYLEADDRNTVDFDGETLIFT